MTSEMSHADRVLMIMERIDRGADWLDEHRPDWLNEIELGSLDMNSPRRCVLGQLAQSLDPSYDYYNVLSEDTPCVTKLFDVTGPLGKEWPIDHGFSCSGTSLYDYGDLDEGWIQVIRTRREKRDHG